MFTPIVPGMLAEMAALTGCRPGSDPQYAAALVTYHSNGRPKEVSISKRSVRRRCDTFVQAAMSALVARPDHALVAEPSDVVFLPLQSSMLACIDGSMSGQRPLTPEDAGITMPVLEHEVKPSFTVEAMRAKVQGKVLIRAMVSAVGCVSRAEVVRALHPELDLEALNAVLSGDSCLRVAKGGPCRCRSRSRSDSTCANDPSPPRERR
jgi:hypothetical protein